MVKINKYIHFECIFNNNPAGRLIIPDLRSFISYTNAQSPFRTVARTTMMGM